MKSRPSIAVVKQLTCHQHAAAQHATYNKSNLTANKESPYSRPVIFGYLHLHPISARPEAYEALSGHSRRFPLE